MQKVGGWWYPDGDCVTKSLRARLETEAVYRGDRLEDALKHVTHWHTALDVGAHVGCWTRELSPRFTRVIAIEPNPELGPVIAKNCAGCANVEVIPMAAGERAGYAALDMHKGSISSALRLVRDSAVRVAALDSLALKNVDYLKVHCNGYELNALKGARGLIERWRPVLTVVLKPALQDYGATPEEVHAFLAALGYTVVSRFKPYFVFKAA